MFSFTFKTHFKKLSKLQLREPSTKEETSGSETRREDENDDVDGDTSKKSEDKNLAKKHGGILGLCSIVSSYPYEMPTYLPDTVQYLCQFANDSNALVQSSVTKCLSEFKRTHHNNWQEHKLSFNDSQLEVLNDFLKTILN